jgi:hypothetical protein
MTGSFPFTKLSDCFQKSSVPYGSRSDGPLAGFIAEKRSVEFRFLEAADRHRVSSTFQRHLLSNIRRREAVAGFHAVNSRSPKPVQARLRADVNFAGRRGALIGMGQFPFRARRCEVAHNAIRRWRMECQPGN